MFMPRSYASILTLSESARRSYAQALRMVANEGFKTALTDMLTRFERLHESERMSEIRVNGVLLHGRKLKIITRAVVGAYVCQAYPDEVTQLSRNDPKALNFRTASASLIHCIEAIISTLEECGGVVQCNSYLRNFGTLLHNLYQAYMGWIPVHTKCQAEDSLAQFPYTFYTRRHLIMSGTTNIDELVRLTTLLGRQERQIIAHFGQDGFDQLVANIRAFC